MKKSRKIIKINNFNIKKLKILEVFLFITLILLIFKLAYIQFIDGPSLSKEASSRQTSTKTINPNRGTIYDSKGKVLAISSGVDTVSDNTS